MPGQPDDGSRQREKVLATERQRRRRAGLTPDQRAAEREADRARKARRLASPDYQNASPEERWHERGRRGIPLRERPFVGVDGEAGYRHTESCASPSVLCGCTQDYVALTVGSETLQNLDGSRLTTWQCLEFLTSQPKDARYVGFYIDFDVTHILRDLPIPKLRQVAHPETHSDEGDAMCWVTDPDSGILYGIRHIPHKFLTLIRAGDPILDELGQPLRTSANKIRRVKGTGRRITVYDIFGYFQTSFIDALEKWNVGTDQERRLIAAGKKDRPDFALPLPERVIAYNILECGLMAELMRTVDAAAEALGLELRKYYGAGTLAELLIDKFQVAEHRESCRRPPALLDAIDRAFFGGRFETAVVGVVPEMHNIDIASAHPAGMVSLPCLAHGQWRHLCSVDDREVADLAPSAVLRVRWDVSWSSVPFGPFPYRCRDGSLLYPLAGHGWYWKDEVDAAIACFGKDCFEIAEAWTFTPTCPHQPFAWINGVYEQRVKLGKDGPGLVLKLGLNSVYGKLAQTVGRAQYAEFAWAGMITARTRARLLEILERAGEHVVMLATDGAYLDCPPEMIAITTSEAPPLGGWEYRPAEHIYRDALIVQSGFWLDGEHTRHGTTRDDAQVPASGGRTRGFAKAGLAATRGRERLYDAFRQNGIGAWVSLGLDDVVEGERVPMAFVGIRGALHLGKPEWLATWQPFNKTISFDPMPKRIALPQRPDETFTRTVPAPNDEQLGRLGVNARLELSAPYSRIARKDQEKDIVYEQPEYLDGLDYLFSEDA